ncbi:MAG: hypothetical protein ACI9FB_004511 [Candidatus Azotimanducaceae bacterium]|jgi:hypothetical protein
MWTLGKFEIGVFTQPEYGTASYEKQATGSKLPLTVIDCLSHQINLSA